jgi:hypothetical protein
MPTVFAKLNLKDHQKVLILNAPDSFEPELEKIPDIQVFRRTEDVKQIQFALAFVTKRIELDRVSRAFASKAAADPVLWFAYPKGSSKKFSCDFNRDEGWDVLRKSGFDSVRMVAIDQDWSALRFRRAEFIKRAQ